MSILAIETNRLSKRFGRRIGVLDLSVQIPAGIAYGFLGPNGAGKSTTISLLLGLVRPSAGSVRLLGQEVSTRIGLPVGVAAVLERSGFLPHLTAVENLRLLSDLTGRPVRPGRIFEVLDEVALLDDAHERVGRYSQGMERRLAIAAALLEDPKLLILDEPTNGLDIEARYRVMRILKRLVDAGITIFFSTHLLSEVQELCSAVAVIEHGTLLFSGDAAYLANEAAARTQLRTRQHGEALALLAAHGLTARDAAGAIHVEATPAQVSAILTPAGIEVEHLAADGSLEEAYLRLFDKHAPKGVH